MKTYQSWLLGALACATIVPFTGCTKDEMVGPNGGNGETVKTELALVLSKKVDTKAVTEEVDQAANFLGIKNIHLLSFNDNASEHYVTAESGLISNITLGDFNAFEDGIDNVKIYQNINFPKKDVNFMFYGQSQYDGRLGVNDFIDPYPAVTVEGTNKASAISFKLNKIQAGEGAEMITYISGVLKKAVDVLNANTTDKEKLQQKFQSYVEDLRSPALRQVAYFMAQLYFDAEFTTVANWDEVKGLIASSSGNFVFTDVPTGIEDVSNKINTANENYLGSDFPVGGKDINIECTLTTGSLNVSKVEIIDDENGSNYNYPTPLYYMANTYPVAYTDDDLTNWNNVKDNEYFQFSTKTPTKIALKDQIEFAVGQLNLKFKVKDGGILGTNEIEGTDDKLTLDNLEVVGILVNNQEKVTWNFIPTPGETPSGIAYDNLFGEKTIGEDLDANKQLLSMLVLPTPKDQVVKFVLEVKNSGRSFKGQGGGIIPSGATFYVAGELDPAKGTGSVTSENSPAAFSSDYITTVDVTLNSLMNATETVPDLNAANLELALSVDLSWQSGLEFDVTIP